MSKPLSLLLLLLTATFTLWKGIEWGSACWTYYRLSSQIMVQVDEWTIKELTPSKYAVCAHYSFEWEGKKQQGNSLAPPPFHLNKYAAWEEALRSPKGERLVWIDSKNPEFSQLDKKFPAKELVYALVPLGFFLYFFALSPKNFLAVEGGVVDKK